MMNQGENEHGSGEANGGDKNVHTMSTQLINQPVNCPWTSRAPLTAAGGSKNSPREASPPNHLNPNAFSFRNQNESNQQSSSQFFHFLRLMQLFPDVHPATLHTVMTLCKNDFFTAVDKLLYAKRCKSVFAQRRKLWTMCNANKVHQHPIYAYNGCVSGGSQRQPTNGIRTNFVSQTPSGSMCTSETGEVVFPSRSMDSSRFVYRNRSKSKVAKPDTDLPLVTTPQCDLPIRPLSPIPTSPQDLSSPQNDDMLRLK